MSAVPARGLPEAQPQSEPWTVLRTMLWSADYLKAKGVESARLDAEYLLAHVLGLGRLEMYLQHERPLTSRELDEFRPLLKRRAKREPLQYVLGRQAFRSLDLKVGPGVLIPRPETEQLVQVVLEWARAERATPVGVDVGAGRARPEPADLTGLDVGTGSGAIALALLTEGPFERFVGTDVSAAALGLAALNRDALGLNERLELRAGGLLEPVQSEERFDVVVSNPPYVSEQDRGALAPEIVDWEPAEALFGGSDGLSVIRSLVAGAGACLRPGGLLALEVGLGQAKAVAALMEAGGLYREVQIRRDLAGKERIVAATWSGSNIERGA
ncbi:MAG: peptide chain release factor N(5)-glutamine methyltransferase [Gemmatimonadetes bacterium]|nr:peptide chain release factor N(5)-glutamine methyltransferase [Gemmatimonadota bacterium]